MKMLRLFAALLALLFAIPAQAAVTVTFWSHELGNHFPHAFLSFRGVPDAGGPPVDANFGFTAKKIGLGMLSHSVPGMMDIAKPDYIAGSNAQFSIVLTDAQYASLLALVDEWGTSGDSHYNINDRNCISFVKEAARRLGLVDLDQPALMKKPRSYLKTIAAANAATIHIIDEKGDVYLASLPPLETSAAAVVPMAPVAPAVIPETTMPVATQPAPQPMPATN